MRILLADNQSKVRFALRALLEQQPGLTVVGEAAEAGDAFVSKTDPPERLLEAIQAATLVRHGKPVVSQTERVMR